MNWPARQVRVRAPATSANLGPGFDALGLALELHDEVDAAVTGGGLTIEVSGEGRETATAGERHLVARAMRAAFAAMGSQPPGIALRCVNSIPHGRGLGSSAAAIVSGLLAARALTASGAARLPDEAVLQLAVTMEGHPDNVAACLAGGLTIAWNGAVVAGGKAQAHPARAKLARVPVDSRVAAVICVPAEPLPTEEARRVLPAAVPHADAAANSGRSALLIAALSGDPSLLLDATLDFLHQRYRTAVMPASAHLVSSLRRAGIAAVMSGAGPSVLALTVTGGEPDQRTVDSIARETGIAWRVIPLDIDRHGATVQTSWPDPRLPESVRQGRSPGTPRDRGAGHAERSP